MGFYLLYNHLDHLLDELECAQRAYGTVYAYVKLLEQRSEQMVMQPSPSQSR